MGIQHLPIPAHWNYFLALEEDVRQLARWIEFSPANEGVYSIEIARLLMTAAAEADVIAKALCARISPGTGAASINAYQSVLCAAAPIIVTSTASMPRYGMAFQPWSNWATAKTPPAWWTGNNKVKHHRATHFQEANLKNLLNACAGLLILLLILHSADGDYLFPAPSIYAPGTFGMLEGDAIRLLNPDGTQFPW